jgi:hypothetical protein
MGIMPGAGGPFDWEKYIAVPGFFFHCAGLFLLTLVTFSYFFYWW